MRWTPSSRRRKPQVTACKSACDLFEVSKSAYYQRQQGRPLGPGALRRRADREDHRHPRRVQGDLWLPAGARSCAPRRGLRPAPGAPSHAPAGLEGRCKKRWRKTTVADPAAEAARDLIQRHFGPARSSTAATSATSPTSPPGRAGPTWPPSSTWPAAGWSAGRWPTTCAPSWSPTP